MTLPTGAISASQINVELGRASNAAFNINDSAVRALAGKPSGAISFNDLRGKTYSTGTASLTGQDLNAYVASGTSQATYAIDSNGNVYQYINGAGASFIETWKSGSAASNDYEAYVSVNSGVLSSGTTNSWLNLGSARQWSLSNAILNSSRYVSLTVSIRKISTQVITAQVTVTLEADVGLVG